MDSKLTIGELSEATGVTAKTIRFYEEIKLITPAGRTANGYRFYNPSAAEELRVIKYARELGLPIDRIRRLMKGCENGDCRHSREYLETEISDYTELLDEKISQMTELRDRLEKLRSAVASGKPGCEAASRYCCDILHQITSLPKGGE